MVGIQEAFWGCLVDNLGQLPSQVHRILHTGVEALSTHRVMHMCGVAGQQHPPVAVSRGLPSHIGEPRDPGGTVDPVVGTPYGDQRLAEIAQGGFGRGSDVLFGNHDPYRPPIHVDHLAVADLVLQPTEGVDAEGVAVGTLLSTYRPLWTDNLLAKRRRAAVPSAQKDLLWAYGCSRGARSSSPSSARPARTSSRAPPVSRSSSPRCTSAGRSA